MTSVENITGQNDTIIDLTDASVDSIRFDQAVLSEMRAEDAIREAYRTLGAPFVAKAKISTSEIVGENEPLYGWNGARI